MRIETRDGATERSIVIGMVSDTTVVAKIATLWRVENPPFSARYANLVGGWCVRFYRKHNAAPGRSIEGIYRQWAEKGHKDEETVNLVERFLSGLSDEAERGEQVNSAWLVDLAGTWFEEVRLRKLADGIKGALEAGRLDEAQSLLSSSKKIELGVGSGIKLFTDEKAVRSTFEKGQFESVIEFPGALGEFFQNSLGRDCLVSIEGMEKGGKTFVLSELIYQAILQRKRVAYFQCGDLSEHQIKIRLLVRNAVHPYFSKTGNWPVTVDCPKSVSYTKGEDHAIPDVEKLTFDKPLDANLAWDQCQRLWKDIRSKRDWFILSVHPMKTISVEGIRSILRTWEMGEQPWTPDCVAIDYPDILAPINERMERREAINETWMALRRMSQELHCLVLAPSQVKATSYTRKTTLGMEHFSEDKRKRAIVTASFGLNQTGEEKDLGVMRLRWICNRENDHRRIVHVAGSLALANPIMVSCF